MKIQPGSLFGQIVLLLLLVIGFNFLVYLMAVRILGISPGARQVADSIATQTLLLQELASTRDAGSIRSLVQGVVPAGQLEVAVQAPDAELPGLMFFDVLRDRLRQHLGSGLDIGFQSMPGQERIWIRPSWSRGHWLGFRLPGYVLKTVTWIFVLAIASALLSALLGGWYARRISRSLHDLGIMAELAYRGREIPWKGDSGPLEVRRLTAVIGHYARRSHELVEYRKMLLAGISHDLRTPMARIRFAAEMLADDELRAGLEQDIEEMDAIIGNFIAYVRDGDSEAFQMLDLPAIARDVCAAQRRAQHSVQLCIEGDIPPVRGQPLAVQRALENLLANAFRHGMPPVVCRIHADSRWVCVQISDHGTGIPAELRDAVRQPFVQGDSSRGTLGSGLGLAIVQKIADQHGADFRLHNRREGGLRASLCFSCGGISGLRPEQKP